MDFNIDDNKLVKIRGSQNKSKTGEMWIPRMMGHINNNILVATYWLKQNI